MSNEREERHELNFEELNAVSGGVGPITGGKPKPKFPANCPYCEKPLVVTRLNRGDTVVCGFCEQEVHAL